MTPNLAFERTSRKRAAAQLIPLGGNPTASDQYRPRPKIDLRREAMPEA